MKTKGSENRKSAQESDSTRPGRTEKVSQIEHVGGKGHGTLSFKVHNHPEVCDVSKTPGGKMDK